MGGLGGFGPTGISLGMFERKKENEITVAKSGGDFTTIEAALAVAVARDTILVSPGIYVENNPLVAVANVSIVSTGGATVTRIQALNANQDLFNSADALVVEGMSLAMVSGTGWIVDITSDHSVLFRNCAFFQNEQGVRCNHVDADLGVISGLWLSTAGVTLTTGIQNNAGNVTVAGSRILEGASITTMFDFDGANAISTIENITSFEAGVGTMVLTDNDARSVFTSCEFVGMNDAVVAQGGSDIRLVGSSIFLAQQDAIRIPAVGADTNVVGQGLTIEDSTRYDINALCATCTFSGYGSASLDKMNFASGSSNYFLFVDLKEDDEGTNVLGELHVGSPEQPAESVFGGGDSYTRGMLVYTYNPAGAVWTDVSTEARSASGSTFTFPAIAQNNAIYVASSLANGGDFLRYPGIKLSQTVAVVLGGGEIVVEYWTGAAWVETNHVSTLADTSAQYAKAIFERTGSEQLYYNPDDVSLYAKSDDPTVGTDYYWLRFRIATGITTVPVFEQFKLHTDRTELNANGILQFFGEARPERELITHIQIASAVVGSAPANASVAFTATTSLSLTRNQFNDNQVHSFGQQITIPTGLDTSAPITIEDVWYPDTANGGDVELRAIPGQLEVGDLFDGSIVDGATIADINTVAAGSRWQSRKSTFDIDVSDLVPGDGLVVKVERDATGGNDPPDTLSGNIVHAWFRAVGTVWRA